MYDLDKRAAEEFILAYIWVVSHTAKIREGREKGDRTLESLIFWVQGASQHPHDFFWTNGLVVAVTVIQGLYNFGEPDPAAEAKVRPAMEQMYPKHYPKG